MDWEVSSPWLDEEVSPEEDIGDEQRLKRRSFQKAINRLWNIYLICMIYIWNALYIYIYLFLDGHINDLLSPSLYQIISNDACVYIHIKIILWSMELYRCVYIYIYSIHIASSLALYTYMEARNTRYYTWAHGDCLVPGQSLWPLENYSHGEVAGWGSSIESLCRPPKGKIHYKLIFNWYGSWRIRSLSHIHSIYIHIYIYYIYI